VTTTEAAARSKARTTSGGPTRSTGRDRQKWRKRRSNLFAYAVLTLFALITVFPFVWMILATFKSRGEIFILPPTILPEDPFEGGLFSAYEQVLTDHNFVRYLLNSTFVATMAALGQIITATLAGFAFAKMTFRGAKVFFGLLVVSLMVPVEVTIIQEFFIVFQLGWLNTYLPLIVPSFLVGAFGTFMMRQFFRGIPRDLVDAASVDGVSSFRMYWNIFLPLARPALVTLFLIAFISNWNELLRPVLYISDSRLYTVTLGLAAFQGEYGAQWNLLLAGAVLTILPLVVLYIFMQRYIVQGFISSGLD
jgi:multiple sugar transport system permease protein